MNELFSVKDKVVVMTGGAGILGRGISAYLAKEGAKIVILDRDEQAAAKLVESIKADGGEACFFPADVLNKDALEQNRTDILATYGRIDALLNAAGGNMAGATIPPDKTIFDLQIDAFRRVVELNLFGTVLPTMVFAQVMAAQKQGCIVNFSSESSLRPLTRVVGYGTAKAAVSNFTKYMAAELSMKFGEGLRVNAIAPGWIDTPMFHKATDNDPPRLAKIMGRIPAKTVGDPMDVGMCAAFLCSDAARYISGSCIPVDGGALIGF